MQLPGCVVVNVATDTEQPAVLDVTAYETSPLPDPPEVASVTAVPPGTVVGEVEIVSVAWDAVNVNVTEALVASSQVP